MKPPSNACTCPTCGGWGHFYETGTVKKHCYNCGGRGWVPPTFFSRFSQHPEANDRAYKPPGKGKGAKVNGRFHEGIH